MKYLLLIIGFFISFPGFGQDGDSPFNSTQISLLTCGPDSDDPSAMYGHTAIRLYDPARKIDIVFNYGLFDPSDVWKFIKEFVTGNTQYIVGAQNYSSFLESYRRDQRWMKEQVLDLDDDQKRAIEGFLRNNIKVENREYLYQFFYDNCSTRVKDLLEELLPAYEYHDSPIKMASYRQLINEYSDGLDWTDFGIEIIIAAPGDEVVDHHGQMFLPDYLMQYMDRFQTADGKKLVSETYDVLTISKDPPTSFWITPQIIFGFLLLLELLLFFKKDLWGSKWTKGYDITWYIIVALASGLLLFMLSTLHYPCHSNYNLLWLSPLFIPFLFLQFMKHNKLRLWIGCAIMSILLITFALWTRWPQVLPSVGMFITMTLILKVARDVKTSLHLNRTVPKASL